MASVVHELWVGGDRGLLIMPSSIPVNIPEVRSELTRQLGEEWNAVVDKDVDGRRSVPYRIDAENPRFGKPMAARRVARAIFMGSAPSVREQRVRGVSEQDVRLAVLQPGEQVSLFNDALNKLGDSLQYLYSANKRYWFDLRPNLRRTALDRAEALRREPEKVEEEIKRRLRAIRERVDFCGVHKCVDSGDVPDDREGRLVVLSPGQVHKKGDGGSPAMVAAQEILDNRGSAPRHYKNMLVFAAADQDVVNFSSNKPEGPLCDDVREFLAWHSIVADAEHLNLDPQQCNQAGESESKAEDALGRRLNEAYSWLFVPTQEGTGPIVLAASRIPGSSDNLRRQGGGETAQGRVPHHALVAGAPAHGARQVALEGQGAHRHRRALGLLRALLLPAEAQGLERPPGDDPRRVEDEGVLRLRHVGDGGRPVRGAAVRPAFGIDLPRQGERPREARGG